jgi:hypothetical protein
VLSTAQDIRGHDWLQRHNVAHVQKRAARMPLVNIVVQFYRIQSWNYADNKSLRRGSNFFCCTTYGGDLIKFPDRSIRTNNCLRNKVWTYKVESSHPSSINVSDCGDMIFKYPAHRTATQEYRDIITDALPASIERCS